MTDGKGDPAGNTDSGSPFYAQAFDTLRIKAMKAQGVSDDRVAREYVEHRRLEIPVPLDRQLRWLEESGFTDTECFWKYLNLAMFGGRKKDPWAWQVDQI